jgi:hypothetical protein
MVSHEKVLNEAMCTQDDVYLSIFSIMVFIIEIRKTYTMLIVFLLNCPNKLYEFFTAYKIKYLHFSYRVFEGVYMMVRC